MTILVHERNRRGVRRGEIIRLPGDTSEISPAELQALNEALDALNSKLEMLSLEVHATAEATKQLPGSSQPTD